MKTHKNRGFTLIELLVVIAIIGILSAVVLASLSTARQKGNDASVKANLHTVVNQAAVFFPDNKNSYGTFDDGAGGPMTCPTPGAADASVFGNTIIENAIASAKSYSPGGGTASCVSSNTTFAVAVSRPPEIASTTSSYWCVDNTGKSCGTNTLPVGGLCDVCATTE